MSKSSIQLGAGPHSGMKREGHSFISHLSLVAVVLDYLATRRHLSNHLASLSLCHGTLSLSLLLQLFLPSSLETSIPLSLNFRIIRWK